LQVGLFRSACGVDAPTSFCVAHSCSAAGPIQASTVSQSKVGGDSMVKRRLGLSEYGGENIS
jgi:hypothetical protein